jgi:hypothetical protein
VVDVRDEAIVLVTKGDALEVLVVVIVLVADELPVGVRLNAGVKVPVFDTKLVLECIIERDSEGDADELLEPKLLRVVVGDKEGDLELRVECDSVGDAVVVFDMPGVNDVVFDDVDVLEELVDPVDVLETKGVAVCPGLDDAVFERVLVLVDVLEGGVVRVNLDDHDGLLLNTGLFEEREDWDGLLLAIDDTVGIIT